MHRTLGATFANDAMSKEGELIVDMRDMGFLHTQLQLQVDFQERTAFFSNGLSLGFGSFDNDDKVIAISAVRHRRFPLSILSNRNRSRLKHAEVPGPAILTGFLVQVGRLQPLIKLIEHDIGQEW